MLDLLKIRDEIDKIDRDIVKLFEERMKLCCDVAEYKIATGKPVFDKKREIEKIDKVRELAANDFNRLGVEELFTQIMTISRKLQYRLLEESESNLKVPFTQIEELDRDVRVVHQGVEGAYSSIALNEYFGENADSYHVHTFRDAMIEIEEGRASYAVLPIENSSAGSVNDIYDLLVEFDNYIVAECYLKINHALLALEDAQIEDIKTVYSHPQGLMQCSKFLDRYKSWNQISMQNTALAALKVVEDKDKTQAAIASELSAKIYGLKVLDKSINYNSQNTTRFIIVTNQKVYRKKANKISICFELPHESGTLYNMLSHIIYNNLNMTMIESRPIEGRNWEYRFFVDFEGNLSDSAVKNAIRGISEEAVNMKILGNY